MSRLISNSESNAWQKCKNMYKYAYDWNIKPKKLSDPLYIGTEGHVALELYYTDLKNGSSKADAAQHVKDYLAAKWLQVKDDADSRKNIMLLMELLPRYFARYDGNDWQILEVETQHEIPILDTFSYVMKLDLLVYDKTRFKTILIDHKFTYNFWQRWQYELNVQTPKYIGALRFNGAKIDEAMINLLRYRFKKDGSSDADLFHREKVEFTDIKVRKALSEQIEISQEITKYREAPPAVRERLATRNTSACMLCSFKTICAAELEGQDITVLKEVSYQQNTTYGYNVIPDDVDAFA